MTTFKNKALIKMWANTTVCREKDDVLVIQNYRDEMYYYFEKINGVYNFVMSSINLLWED